MSASASSPGPAVGVDRFPASVARLDHLVILRVFLGAVFITVFFENLAFNRYTRRLRAPDRSLCKLQAGTELGFGIALVVGLASGFVGLSAAGFLLALWLSELGLFWIWELMGLIFVALAVGIGNLPHLLRGSLRDRVLGPPVPAHGHFPNASRWPLPARSHSGCWWTRPAPVPPRTGRSASVRGSSSVLR